MKLGFAVYSVILALLFGMSITAASCQVEVSSKKAGADTLTIIKPAQSSAEVAGFSVTPPDKNDPAVVISFAAAFTTKTSGISGSAICNGKTVGGAVNPHLTGVATFIDGNYQIFSSEHGHVLTPAFLAAVQEAGGSLFQQFLLVKDGTAQSFRELSLAPRRALVVFDGGNRAVVQSVKPLTMGQFARDMQSIGVHAAVYTPVGDADGGWYRNGEKIVSIGERSSPNLVQSNWVVWKKTTSKQDPSKVDEWLHKHKPADAPSSISSTEPLRHSGSCLPDYAAVAQADRGYPT